MGRVLRTERARVDLLEIWLYIAKDSQAAADRLMDRIDATCNTLAGQPLMGQARPELAPICAACQLGIT